MSTQSTAEAWRAPLFRSLRKSCAEGAFRHGLAQSTPSRGHRAYPLQNQILTSFFDEDLFFQLIPPLLRPYFG